MVSSSKILTVSYGTFSCTAEGFDDPLDVVKETTHFFRGVVGEDRFFGAEPPQFDPELASEYLRDRLADSSGGTLTLGSPPRVRTAAASAGAMAASFAAEQARPTPAADLLPDDDTIEATAVLTERPAPEDVEISPEILPVDTVPAGAEAAPAPRSSAPDDIAAKLDRIRAVVAQAEEAEAAAIAEPADMADPVALADDADTDLIPETDDLPDLELSAELLADMADMAEEPAVEEAAELIEPTAAQMFDESDAEEDDADEDETAEIDDDLDDDDDTDEDTTEADSDRDDALESLLEEFVVESTDTEELDFDAIADETADDSEDVTALDAAVADLLAREDAAEAPAPAPETARASALSAAAAAVAALVGGKSKPAQAAPSEAPRTRGDHDEDHADEDALDEAWTTEANAPPPATLRDLDLDLDLEDEDEDDDRIEAEAPAPAPAPSGPPVRARIVKVKRAALEKAIDSGALEEVFDTPTPAAAPASAATPAAPVSESSLSEEEEEELARELAAVKAELASDFGAWDEDDDEDDTNDVAESGWDADDDEEDEDEDDEETLIDDDALKSALGTPAATTPLRLDNPIRTPDRGWGMGPESQSESLEDDGDEDEDEEIPEAVRDSARKAVKMASPARALLTEREVEDDDTSRLLDQTNSEMDEPEGNRRRSAIAHLRAAVAATKADRMLGRKADAAEEQEPYREDLASVVRPRRPQTAGARTERPVSEPATPLKLVAEQRIDTAERFADAAAAAAPVRPRRVRRAEPEDYAQGDAQDDSGFATYARSVGAADLPELLEAAAAYMSYVEGRDQFSRPQLMTTLRQAEVTDSSREDRLRSFGQLLREGKIRKTSGGRFTAAETISFKPAANG
ncbi:hypothetical protein MAA8898_02804 [Maliponia aquimaris]|uniref:Lipoprotein n=2 Tax=Maliponia aquimaris TaxID=1673631 RepID=A0A238KMI1_9RHOB|nr:hypothetical protein MAA8898_02804 [Maliponia aquimaris]